MEQAELSPPIIPAKFMTFPSEEKTKSFSCSFIFLSNKVVNSDDFLSLSSNKLLPNLFSS